MKTTKMFFAMLFLTVLLFGQSRARPSDVIGSWTMHNIPNSQVIFYENHTMAVWDPFQGYWQYGKWESDYEDGILMLVCMYTNGHIEFQAIQKIHDNKLLCTTNINGTMLSWYFLRL